jgi:hypothetical protein
LPPTKSFAVRSRDGSSKFGFTSASVTTGRTGFGLRAAHAFGLEQTFPYHGNRGGFGGVNYQKECEVMIDMLNKGGMFKLTPNILDYFTEITPKWTFSKGDFDGISRSPRLPTRHRPAWSVWAPPRRNAYVASQPGVND